MEKLNIGELNHDTITDTIETCRKTTLELTKLMDKEVLNYEITDNLNWVFDGLWKLIFAQYPLETLEQEKLNDLYTKFQNYLKDDTKTLKQFYEDIENVI